MLIRTSGLFLLPVVVSAATSPFRELFFEPNRGQAAQPVQYLARARGANIGFTKDGLELRLGDRPAIRLRLAGANGKSRFEPLDGLPDRTSYFIGADSSRWVRDVPHYR